MTRSVGSGQWAVEVVRAAASLLYQVIIMGIATNFTRGGEKREGRFPPATRTHAHTQEKDRATERERARQGIRTNGVGMRLVQVERAELG